MKKTVSILLAAVLLFSLSGCAKNDYDAAIALLDSGNYSDARESFAALGDYKDSKEMIKKCDYQMAEQLLDDQQYDEAIEYFIMAGDYEDSKEMIDACNYQKALQYYNSKQYNEAIEAFDAAGNYQDSSDKANECRYILADRELFAGNFDRAEELFNNLGLYKDSANKVVLCKTRRADLEAKAIYEQMDEAYQIMAAYKQSLSSAISLGQCTSYQTVFNRVGTTTSYNVAKYLGTKSSSVDGAKYIVVYDMTYKDLEEAFRAVGDEEGLKTITESLQDDQYGNPIYGIAMKGKLGLLCFWAVQIDYKERISLVRGNATVLEQKLDDYSEKFPQYSELQTLKDMLAGIQNVLDLFDNPDGTITSFDSSVSGKVNIIEKARKELDAYFNPPVKGITYQCTSISVLDHEENDISHSTSEIQKIVSGYENNKIILDDSHERALFQNGRNDYSFRLLPEKANGIFECLVLWDSTPELFSEVELSSCFLSFDVGSGKLTMRLKFGGNKAATDYLSDDTYVYEVCMEFEVNI